MQTLLNIPVKTVEDTRVTVRFMNLMIKFVIFAIIPLAIITPPKHIAHIISQIVFIIPLMPRVATNSVSIAFDVSTEVFP